MAQAAELKELLPWSYPFLMVDRLVECIPHLRAVTSKQVTAGETGGGCFPSVLIVEGLSQTAALLFRLTYGPESLAGAPMLGYLKAKFRNGAKPGDTLLYTVTAIKMTSRRGVFAGVARVGATRVAATELAFGVSAP